MNRDEVLRDYEEYKANGRIWGVIDKENIKLIKFPRIPKEIIDGFKALEDDGSFLDSGRQQRCLRRRIGRGRLSVHDEPVDDRTVMLVNIQLSGERSTAYCGG